MTISNAAKRPDFARWLRSSNDITQQFLAFGGRPDVVSLAGGLPAAELYPVAAVEEATRRALERHGSAALEYGAVEGFPPLRDLIAERIATETGGTFTAANVLLTTGSMQALDLLGKALIDPGDLIVAQAPTYLGALDAWRPRSPSYRKLDWAASDAALLRQAKFAYAVPNYSNPTGVLVSQEGRIALLDAVGASGTWLVEDDPYLTMQLDGPPGPSILSHAVGRSRAAYEGPVVYLGTVSKSLVPGLRVGWAVGDPRMIRTLALAKQATDLSSSMFAQAVAFELMGAGVDRAHSAAILPVYRERRDALCSEAALHLKDWFEWEVPSGGMFVWMRSRNGTIDTDELYKFAVEEKVAFVPSSVFDFTGEDRTAMRVNFTRSSPEVIREGVRRLARAIESYVSSRPQLKGKAR